MLNCFNWFFLFFFFEKINIPILPECPWSKPEREMNLLLGLRFMRNKGQRHNIKLIFHVITACQTLAFFYMIIKLFTNLLKKLYFQSLSCIQSFEILLCSILPVIQKYIDWQLYYVRFKIRTLIKLI